jgi:hypothetical protein
MPTVTAGQENNSDIEIYYEDHGVSSDGLKPYDDLLAEFPHLGPPNLYPVG